MSIAKRLGFSLAAVGFALIIIAVAVVASGVGRVPVAPVQAATSEKVSPDEFYWHDTPIDGPATVFKDASDADKTLGDFGGKVLVVNFWATWCAPCVKEMPTLDRLQANLGGPDFEVVAINQDRQGATVAKPFADKNGWKNLPLHVEPAGRFSRDAKLRGLPTTLIIGKDGKELGRVEGEVEWDSAEVEKVLREILAR
jgi:thiol-disulfide isomerase/thioredoxin